jgi:DNA-binding beta-propeller fold protein YncE
VPSAPRRRLFWPALLVVALAIVVAVVLVLVLRPPAPPLTAGAWPAAVTTIAGRGTPGTLDGPASRAAFSDPSGIAVAPDGRIYVADAGDSNRVRRIDPDGLVVTLAGGAGERLLDGPRGMAAFHTPSGLAFAADGTLFVADTGNHAIRRVTPDGAVTTLAGTGARGYRDGDAVDAAFDGPMGVAVAPDGAVYVADTYNDRIRRIGPDGRVTTVAGSGVPGFFDGAASSAQFDTPAGIAVAPDGALLVADTGNGVVRRISGEGDVTTLLLEPLEAGHDVSLFRPVGIAAGRDGAVYVTDRRGRIVHVLPDGGARVLAGSASGFADGLGADARLHNPAGVAVDGKGALVVADALNYLVRRIAPPGLYPPDPPRSPLAPAPGLPLARLAWTPLLWPVDDQFEWHEVTGTIGEARGSTGGDGRERFHTGVDIRGPEGAVVRAIRDGKVDSPLAALGFGTLNESLAISPFTYIHIRVGRDRSGQAVNPAAFPLVTDAAGTPTRVRVRRGTRFQTGDVIGTTNRFSHVHLNVGAPGREMNALTLPLVNFADSVPPTIERVTFFDEYWRAITTRARNRTVVSGRVRIVVDAWDRVDGNAAHRRLGLFRLGYGILQPDRTPIPGLEPRTTLLFDRLPRAPGASALVYASGSGITVYGNRRTRFLYIVTNWMADGETAEGLWDTTALPPGDYVVRIIAADSRGNEATANRDVPVTVAAVQESAEAP